MAYNSIYGNLFKVSSYDNIFNLNYLTKKNLPDFFLRLISKTKSHKESLNPIKDNNNINLKNNFNMKNKSNNNKNISNLNNIILHVILELLIKIGISAL